MNVKVGLTEEERQDILGGSLIPPKAKILLPPPLPYSLSAFMNMSIVFFASEKQSVPVCTPTAQPKKHWLIIKKDANSTFSASNK